MVVEFGDPSTENSVFVAVIAVRSVVGANPQEIRVSRSSGVVTTFLRQAFNQQSGRSGRPWYWAARGLHEAPKP